MVHGTVEGGGSSSHREFIPLCTFFLLPSYLLFLFLPLLISSFLPPSLPFPVTLFTLMVVNNWFIIMVSWQQHLLTCNKTILPYTIPPIYGHTGIPSYQHRAMLSLQTNIHTSTHTKIIHNDSRRRDLHLK